MNYGPDNPIPPSSVAPPRYQPIRTLREGGFGRVLLAMDTLTQKQVAVKVLKATWSATHQARFRREVEGTRKLRSHRVIKILGYELANNPPFYVMPYLSRGSLRQHLMDLARKQEVFSQPAALIAAATIAEGLRIAHDAGVHHRDLKPRTSCSTTPGISCSPTSDRASSFIESRSFSRLRVRWEQRPTVLPSSGRPMMAPRVLTFLAGHDPVRDADRDHAPSSRGPVPMRQQNPSGARCSIHAACES